MQNPNNPRCVFKHPDEYKKILIHYWNSGSQFLVNCVRAIFILFTKCVYLLGMQYFHFAFKSLTHIRVLGTYFSYKVKHARNALFFFSVTINIYLL